MFQHVMEITHCTAIEGEITYMEMDGLAHFSINSQGNDLEHQWKINGSENLILNVTDNGNAITTPLLPLGKTHIVVKISNDIGSDLRTIIVVNTANSGTYCICIYTVTNSICADLWKLLFLRLVLWNQDNVL